VHMKKEQQFCVKKRGSGEGGFSSVPRRHITEVGWLNLKCRFK